MTAENTTSAITEARTILRHRLAVPQSTRANTRQTKAAAKVPQGARWRRAMARTRADGVWWRNGRMTKAGTKNNPMPAKADTLKRNHRYPRRLEDGCIWLATPHGSSDCGGADIL